MKWNGLLILLFSLWALPSFCVDNIVVVVNKKSEIQKLTPAQAKAIFLGDTRFGAPGLVVEVNERDRASDLYRDFYFGIAAMSPKDVSIHWARKVFTGEAPPPARLAGDDAAALKLLKTKPDAITYIYEKNINNSVKVVYSISPK